MKKISLFLSGILVGALIFGSAAMSFAATGISVDFVPLNYFFNGEQKYPPSDQQGFIYNGRTYVPLRFMSESLGCDVQWDGSSKSIYVTSSGNTGSSYEQPVDNSNNGQDTGTSTPTTTGPTYLTDVLEPYALQGAMGTAKSWTHFNEGLSLGSDTYYKNFYIDGPGLYNWKITYNLNGNYTKLTFKVVVEASGSDFAIKTDDEIVWQEPLSVMDIPKEVTIDLTDVNKLDFVCYGDFYIIEPILE